MIMIHWYPRVDNDGISAHVRLLGPVQSRSWRASGGSTPHYSMMSLMARFMMYEVGAALDYTISSLLLKASPTDISPGDPVGAIGNIS